MDSIELLLSSLFVLVALILGSVGYFVRKRTIGNCNVEVMATISDLDWTKGFNGPRISFSIYEFDYNGEHYQVRANTSSGKRKRGVQEKLWIDPSDPTKTYRTSDLYIPYFLMGWSILVLLSMFCYLLFH